MTSPYYMFGIQRRYPFQWNGGQGGVLMATRPAPTSLGMADMLESGYGDPNYLPYPALDRVITKKCPVSYRPPDPSPPRMLRAKASAQLAAVGDWPLVRRAGPEPVDPNEGVPFSPLGMLSDNEKKLVYVAGGALAAYLLFFHGKRRNPWAVTRRSRGVTGTLVFRDKASAKDYAAYVKRAYKKRTRIKRVKR